MMKCPQVNVRWIVAVRVAIAVVLASCAKAVKSRISFAAEELAAAIEAKNMGNRLRHHLPVRRMLFVVGLPLIFSGMLAGCRAAVDTAPNFGTQTTSDQTYVSGIVITPLVLPEASSGDGTLSYKLTGDLPEGLSFDAGARTLTGTPTAVGTYAMTYRVEDADGDAATLRFRILVVPPDTEPSFGPHMIADQRYITGTAITALVLPEATGGNGTLSYMLTGDVPDGLGFDAGTRGLSGTPISPGTYDVTYQATDMDDDVASLPFTITVEVDTAPSFGTQQVPEHSYIAGYEIDALMLPEATGGNGPLSYMLTGDVPGGLSFDTAKHGLVGTPSKGTAASPISFPRTYEMGLHVTDSDINEATGDTATLSITIELVRRIYWTNKDESGLQRGNLDGSDIIDIYDGGYVGGVALNITDGEVYWSTGDTIKRASRDGIGDTEELVVELSEALDIALDLAGEKMYWADLGTGKIQRANLDGTGVEDLVVSLEAPFGIALDVMAGKIYWADVGADIQRANLDGSDVEDLVTVLESPTGLAIDTTAGKIYWTDGGTEKIQRANLDGTNIEDLVTTGLEQPQWIVIDEAERRMYWGDYGVGSIRYANLDGSNVTDLITGFDDIQGFAIE